MSQREGIRHHPQPGHLDAIDEALDDGPSPSRRPRPARAPASPTAELRRFRAADSARSRLAEPAPVSPRLAAEPPLSLRGKRSSHGNRGRQPRGLIEEAAGVAAVDRCGRIVRGREQAEPVPSVPIPPAVWPAGDLLSHAHSVPPKTDRPA